MRRSHSHPNVDCVSGRLSDRYNSVHVADLNFSGSSNGSSSPSCHCLSSFGEVLELQRSMPMISKALSKYFGKAWIHMPSSTR